MASAANHPIEPRYHNPSCLSPQQRTPRLITAISFLPALPLLIAHGVISQNVIPAVGLAPLFVSALVGVLILLQLKKKERRHKRAVSGGSYRDDVEGRHQQSQYGHRGVTPSDDDENEESEEKDSVLTHRILIFLVDAGLAAGLLVVLGLTVIETISGKPYHRDKPSEGGGEDGEVPTPEPELKDDLRRAELVMLAAYGTIPLLVNCGIHFYMAIRELIAGLAIHGLIQYTAWQVLPPDCPHCGGRLKPDHTPDIPWYETVSAPSLTVPSVALPEVAAPNVPVPKWQWKTPAWLSRKKSEDLGSTDEDARLFVDDAERYRDDTTEDEGASTTGIVAGTASVGPGPVVEEVVKGKKDKKKRSSSGSGYYEDDAGWP
ncbi:hypothetical protein QBC40DRAFT_204002 [Triangularia verruculosa]|uniref:Uncharacterized protein n=1 Tax=Triangularia verruculosa TaxID=2587418 RepID=A0AAN6XJG8_9PEZI|nr:hypothetical protein QBC40DRAFT_204002 [Triangularia verruculosa]